MIRVNGTHLVWSLLLLGTACNDRRPPQVVSPTQQEQYVQVSGAVPFDLQPIESPEGYSRWMAVYSAQGKVAKFRIELGPARPMEKDDSGFQMKVGEGRFVAEQNSDASIFLAELKKELEAQRIPSKPSRLRELPFTYVNLGGNMSQARDGGFAAQPPGNWTAIKVFLGEGKGEGQVFLNMNPSIGKGQFSIKDAEYGNAVLARFAQVF